MEVLSIKKPKANKEHTCNWCSLKIKKGEIYCNQSCVDEGECYSWKHHIHCASVADAIGMYDSGDGVTGEDFQEYVRSEYQNIMSKHHTELYESKDFKYPNWEGQLSFVLDFHKISNTNGK